MKLRPAVNHPTEVQVLKSSELLEGHLELLLSFHHIEEESHMVAVMLDYVVVHVYQDAGREEEENNGRVSQLNAIVGYQQQCKVQS